MSDSEDEFLSADDGSGDDVDDDVVDGVVDGAVDAAALGATDTMDIDVTPV